MHQKPRIPVTRMLLEGSLPASVQRRIYRRRGYRVASDVELAPGAVVDAQEVDIEQGARIGLGTVIRGRHVRIGRRVTIGSFCFFEGRDLTLHDDAVIREQVFVGGPLFPDSSLELGKRARVFQMCFLNPSRPLSIGDDTGVGGRSSIFTHGSWQSVFEGFPVAFEPVTIGRDVWLPWHVFILPGVEIGDGATIGAGSVVNRSIPPGVLAAGVPAKVLRDADKWPQEITADAQWDLARSMLASLGDYLAANGTPIETASHPDRVVLSFSHRERPWEVALTRDGTDASPAEDIVIQLRGRPDPTEVRATWFALLERSRGGPDSDVADEVADFIARYGVRFSRTDP
jgi:acetyltransferase-like isoleucine patch superfamily enzyme